MLSLLSLLNPVYGVEAFTQETLRRAQGDRIILICSILKIL